MPTIYHQGDYLTYHVADLATRYYDERQWPELHGGDLTPAGYYTDHTDETVQRIAYMLRNRQGENRLTVRQIAAHLEMRHWRDSYNAIRNAGRRIDGDIGRNTDGDLTWRAWSTRGLRQTRGSAFRRFGVELEFAFPGYDGLHTARNQIRDQVRSHGYTFVERWDRYGRDMSRPGWQGTYDGSVTGGEIISDILAGGDQSHDEVRDVVRAIRAAGGTTGRGVGLHVHIDVMDFDHADKVRLVHNLRNVETALHRYVSPCRFGASYSGVAGEWSWDHAVQRVEAGNTPGNDHSVFFNMGHIFSDSANVEFRGLGNTLHAGKIRAWIRVGQAIVQATKAGHSFGPGTTVLDMLQGCRDHGNLSQWAVDRFIQVVTARHGSAALVAA